MSYLFFISLAAYMAWWLNKSVPRRLNKNMRTYLWNAVPYYRYLTEDERIRFEHRIHYYMFNKKFVGRNSLNVDKYKKLLISAVAAKLTFNFDAYRLPHFKRIVVYPKPYYSTITKQFHKGEVNLHGIVVLSWNTFEDGFADSTNGINLGIHEFAHAVYFENLKNNDDYFFIDKPTLQYYYDSAHDEMLKMDAEGHHYFRDYAFTNKEEFFAVSTEYFFEQPQIFKTRLPEFYDCMKQVFLQDPAEIFARTENPLS